MKYALPALVMMTLIFCAAPARAQESGGGDKAARKIIDSCWALSENERSQTGASAMNEGQNLTATCLEDQYIKLFLMTDKSGLNKDRKQLERQFQQLRSAYTPIRDDIHVAGGMDNLHPLLSSTDYNILLQGILSDLARDIQRRKKYDQDMDEAIDYMANFTP